MNDKRCYCISRFNDDLSNFSDLKVYMVYQDNSCYRDYSHWCNYIDIIAITFSKNYAEKLIKDKGNDYGYICTPMEYAMYIFENYETGLKDFKSFKDFKEYFNLKNYTVKLEFSFDALSEKDVVKEFREIFDFVEEQEYHNIKIDTGNYKWVNVFPKTYKRLD